MAKTETKQPIAPAPEEAPARGRSGLGLLIGLVAVSFVLLITLLHIVGALRGAEEGIYAGLKNVPVLGLLVTPFHHEKYSEKLSPDKLVDIKDIRAALIRTQRQEDEAAERNSRDIRNLSKDIDKIAGRVDKMRKDLEEGTYASGAAPATTAAAPAGAIPAPGVAAAAPLPNTAAPARAPVRSGDNFRMVAKIFESISADTAVDILSNLTDEEKVQILAAMKQKNVADIITAMDPKKAAELSRMLAEQTAR